MPNTPPPVVVWAEDADPSRPPPRTEPPRHAYERANELFDRVAGGTRTRRRPARPVWWGFVLAVVLFATAGVVAWFRLDLGLMHGPTVGLAVGGLVVLVKTLMGYR